MTEKIRVAIIAGANAALKYKEKNPNATDYEVMRHVSKSAREIAEGIDETG